MNNEALLFSADTTRIQAGGESLFSKLGDALTAGSAGAAVSAIAGFYNTAAWGVSKLSGNEVEEMNVAETLDGLNKNWADYYRQNSDAIDFVGFVGGSLIPGTAAMKGLQLTRAGQTPGVFGKVLGFTSSKQREYLQRGLKEIADTGPSVFTSLNRNKMLSMSWGAADNMVQGLVFETAALATMHQSNIFKDESAKDIFWDLTTAAVFGGVLGGGVSAIFTNKLFRDAGKAVDKRLRDVDTVTALDTIGLSYGDKAFSVIDSAMDLGKKTDLSAPFVFDTLDKAGKPVKELFQSSLLERKLKENLNKAEEAFTIAINSAITTDPTVGAALSKYLLRTYKQGRTANLPDEDLRMRMGETLFNLARVRGLSPNLKEMSNEIWFMPQTSDSIESAVSLIRKGADDKAYWVYGTPKGGLLGIDAGDVKDAWKADFDFIFDPKSKKLSVNPDSSILVPVSKESTEDPFIRAILNPRTGEMYDIALAPVIADLGLPAVTQGGVSAGQRVFSFDAARFDPTKVSDTLKTSARYLWARSYTGKLPDTIHQFDFALLESPILHKQYQHTGVKVKLDGGGIKEIYSYADMERFVLQSKRQLAMKLAPHHPPEVIAVATNSEKQWLKQLVENEYDISKTDKTLANRALESWGDRENLVLLYDRAAMEQSKESASAIVAYHDRVHEARQINKLAASQVLGEHYSILPDEPIGRGNGVLESTGTGPGALAFSNPDYFDSFRVWAQSSGTAAHLIEQKAVKASHDAVQPAFAKLLSTNNIEFGAILQAYRRHPEALYLDRDARRIVDLKSHMRAVKNPGQTINYAFTLPIRSKETFDALVAFEDDHRKWLHKFSVLQAAKGHNLTWNPSALYLPPVDTRSAPFFAFVRHHQGRLNTSDAEVAMIIARSQEELQSKANLIIDAFGDQVQVIYKSDTADYFKAKQAYDYMHGMHETQIDSFLKRSGKMGEFQPTLDPKAVVSEFVEYITRRESNLVRSAVKQNYAQTFAEIDWLSAQYTKAAKSKMQFLGKIGEGRIKDPFGDYEKLALNISKQSEYTAWKQVNDFVDYLGTGAYRQAESAFKSASAGKISWEDANRQLRMVGLEGPFSSQADFIAAQTGSGKGNLIKTIVAKGNLLATNIGLRLDTAQAIINTLSLPILFGAEVSAIRNSLRKNPELLQRFNATLEVTHPEGFKIPSMWRLLMEGTGNYLGPTGKQLTQRYAAIGAIREPLLQHHAMIQDVALLPNFNASKYSRTLDEAIEKGAKWTGNNFVEEFTRFVAADAMRQMTDPLVKAGAMTLKEQNSWIQIFTNRVQGNYVATQRPIAFQGTVGAAIGLFQTYQFTFLQQLFRHIENKDLKTIAILGALQSGLYGFNGLPLFDAINTHLIGMANMNEGHQDAYSAMAKAVGKEAGDFFMYGAASALPIFSEQMPGLFTRGDLNPRHVTILPNPTRPDQIPIYSMGSRLFSSLKSAGEQMVDGVDMSTAMLFAAQHQGVSRPLAGLATVLHGASTSSKGSLVAAHNDMFSIATATRLIGAKPVNEAIAQNHFFRLNAYKAYDRERIEKLGVSIKQKLRTNTFTEEDALDFMAKYAASGGRIENYSQAMQRWMRNAKQSDVNRLMNAHRSVYGQRLLEVMGGDSLPEIEE